MSKNYQNTRSAGLDQQLYNLHRAVPVLDSNDVSTSS